LRLLTLNDQWQGESVPPNKFMVMSFGGDNDDHPKGLGLGHYLYWPTYFKRAGLQAWLKFLEKAGIPSRVGKYPDGSSEEKQNKLLDAVWALGSDSAVIIPEGMSIDLLESARTVADFTSLYDKMNEAIAKIILNQTFTTEGAGGQYKGDNLVTVRNEVTKSDADLMCLSFNRQPLSWLIHYNRAVLGEDVAIPQVWRDMSEEEDLDKTADTWGKIFALGYEPAEDEVRNKFGEFWRKKVAVTSVALTPDALTPDALTPGPSPIGEGGKENVALPVEMAKAPELEPDTVDVYAERLRAQAGVELDGWLDRIEQELDGAADLSQFADRLYELFPELPSERFAQVMGDALVASSLAGFYESQLEQEGDA
jgi:phage gp29-like protein